MILLMGWLGKFTFLVEPVAPVDKLTVTQLILSTVVFLSVVTLFPSLDLFLPILFPTHLSILNCGERVIVAR
jgi:hypothetical protein